MSREPLDGLDTSRGPLVDHGSDPHDLELDAPLRGRTAAMVSILVAVAAGAFVWFLATGESSANRRAESPLVGRAAPVLQGTTLDGGDFHLDDHQGRIVVVNFFATWCVPCRIEHPELVRFHEAHADRGDAVLMSVLYDDDSETARTYFEEHGGDWPVLLDGDGRTATRYGVAGVPETYVVAPNGRIFAKFTGGVTLEGLEEVVTQLGTAARGS